MALVLANRVQETATPNTTVSFTLTGAVSGFQTFAVIGNTNTTYYSATDTAGNWEVGEGTYSTTGPTLTRTTVYASSNAGSAVTFPGTVNVFVTYPAEVSAYSSNNPGTSGNVLTSNGTGVAPSWQSAPAPACATPVSPGIVYGVSITNGRVSLGYQAGQSFQGVNTVAVGQCAGRFCQASGSVSVGISAGRTSQGGDNVAIGAYSGFANQGYRAIAIGYQAGVTCQPSNSIAIGAFVNATSSCQTHIGPIRSVGSCTGPYQALFYCGTTKEVIQGAAGGGVCCATPTAAGRVYGRTTCGLQGKTALGYQAGNTSQGCYTAAIGNQAGQSNQGNRAVAIGRQAAATSQGAGAVAIGYRAGELNQGGSAIAIGDCAAWNTQRINAIAIGFAAGGANQGACSIAIGANATVYGPMCPFISALAVAVGSNSYACGCGVAFGSLAYASNSSVAVGKGATTLNPANVAIGHNASIPASIGSISIGAGSSVNGSTNNAVAVGTSAFIATCSCYSIAIGNSAQATTKAGGSIAIGYNATAGWTPCCFMPMPCQGSIAIGKNTSVRSSFNTASIAIGANTTIPSYAVASRIIALNATGSSWTVCSTGFYVDPVGQVCSPPNCCSSYALQYCIGNKRISYGPGGGGGGSPATPTVAGVVYGRTDTACCGNNTMLGKSLNVGFAVSSNVVIGTCSTWVRNYNTSNVIVGQSANTCCCVNSSVVVGLGAYAGYGTSFGVAIGGYSSVGGALGVAIGNGAYAGTWAVAVGSMSYAGANSVVLNGTGSLLCSVSNSFYVKPVRNANGPYTLKYDPSSGEITYV